MSAHPATPATDRPRLPPRWIIRTAWSAQRLLYRLTGGRYPLTRPKGGSFGMLRLRTTGRRSGRERAVILGYVVDDGRYVTLAMNGWDDSPPAWWLNLSARPDAAVDTVDGPVGVRGRAATGAERDRLWPALVAARGWGGEDLDRFVAARSRTTPVVVLEPRG
ncbi:nitroreductase/quinone reductase family protein [Myceligenerans indicum]|uniref:Nitroreductase family deazaflavin-dependent oxidoreductase n=1 Tax=Myceligenerans indicum TaxID=2593663 RepID=A0ABS1LT53_9MICO|nr:nitroreductase/quinone reductase family protein [Myceligenerans indicum]MBL0888677.1 nitroreductase family deazaflavin-dependent oxidoreductase [Myceligenerans indicum]